MTSLVSQKVQRILQSAEDTRLYGEIVLRYRDGHLVFVIETRTTPAEVIEDETREFRSSR